MPADFWTVLSAVSTCIGALVVSLASVFAFAQIREISGARSLEALMGIFDEVSNTETNNARNYVLTYDLPPPGQLTPDIYEKMRMVWIAFDKVGVMVAHKMIPEELVMETYYGSIIASWEKWWPPGGGGDVGALVEVDRACFLLL